MKKFFLLSALALCAMTMSAQLTLQCTINEGVDISTRFGYGPESLPIQYLYNCVHIEQQDSTTLNLFNLNDGSLFKTIQIGKYGTVIYASKNFWTTDDKVSFIAVSYNKDEKYDPVLMDEDGNILQSFPTNCIMEPLIFYTNSGYKLILFEEDNAGHDYTYIYSIPGNGQPTDLESPTAPARTSNARKVVENGQIYIILDGVKYAVTGSSIL